ncbi:MAG: TetR/AcrR family transcriptional regulator [Bacteroidales bacterium]|nr:TetR/AcrR family transcriptional regulator [Bacteroidales bacterium]
MGNTNENTELKIIEAARKVFILKGMDGARMQEIADEAGINKALLHYYFRSKTKLFDRVFLELFSEVVAVINAEVEKAGTLEQLIESLVSNYIQLISEKPFVPDFVLHELNRNPEMIIEYIQHKGLDLNKVFRLFQDETLNHVTYPISPVHLIVDVLALCVFPFVAKPIIKGFMLEDDELKYKKFIAERVSHVTGFIKSALFINPQQS